MTIGIKLLMLLLQLPPHTRVNIIGGEARHGVRGQGVELEGGGGADFK